MAKNCYPNFEDIEWLQSAMTCLTARAIQWVFNWPVDARYPTDLFGHASVFRVRFNKLRIKLAKHAQSKLETPLQPIRHRMRKHLLSRLVKASPSLWLSAVMLLVVAVTFGLYVHAEKKIDRANEQRLSSIVLADQLRHSSDDLTQMARSYAVTGDPRYKRHYQEIRDIRDGKKPRPEGYFRSYWDLVLADAKVPQAGDGPAVSLLDLMRQVGFAADEFRKLSEAKTLSDELSAIEFKAMQLAETVGPEAELNRSKARLMLNDAPYLLAKAAIMRPINASFELMEKRTSEQVQAAERIAVAFRVTFIVCTLVAIFMLWRAYAAIRRILGGAAQEVHAHIVRIGRGALSSPIPLAPGMENSVLAGLLSMQIDLRNSQLRQSAIFAASPDAMLIADAQGLITQANQQVEGLLGYTGDELIGRSIDELVPKRMRAAHPAQRNAFAAWPEGRRMGRGLAVKAQRKDGSEVDVEVSLSRIESDQGYLFVSALRNITERRQYEEEIHRLLTENEMILDNVVVGIVYFRKRRVVSCNRRFEELFGYDRGELIGESSERLYASREIFEHIGKVAYELAPDSNNFTTEVRLRRKDGSEFWGSLSGRAIDPVHPHEGSIWIYTDITRIKLADDDLRIAASAFEAHQGMVVTDASDVIIRVNRAFSEITGYPAGEAVGQRMNFLRSDRHDESFFAAMWRDILENDIWQGEIWNRRRNGDVHPHWLTITAVKGVGDVTTHYVGTYTDITARKQAEAALQESYNALHSVLETTLDGYWRADSQGWLVDVNQTYCRQSGYARDELLSMRIVDLEAKESNAETAAHIQHIIESGSDQFESIHRRKDGTLWHVEVSTTYRAVAGGQFFVFVRDIGDRWLAETKLRESELRTRTIIDNEPECIKIVDAQGLLRQMNRAGLAMIEAESMEQVARLSLLKVIAPEYREAFTAMHKQVLAGETRELEFEVIGLKGGRRWLETHATPMQDHGETVHLAVTRDITARKLAEAGLRETEILNRAILDSVGAQIAVLDSEGVIIAVNEPWERFALENSPIPGQPTPGTDVGVSYLEVCQGLAGNATDGLMTAREGIQAVLGRRQSRFAIEYSCHSPTQQRWFNMTVTPLGAVGRGAVIAHTDITNRKLAEADLRIAASAFDTQEGIIVTDVGGKVLRINKAFTETTGYTAEDIVGQTPRLLRSGRHDAEFYRAMWESIRLIGAWQGEIWDRRKSGEIYPKWLTISAVKGDDGAVTHYVGTHFDITERKKAEEKIEELAFFDQLTGLPNRTLLMDRLKQAMTAGNRNGCFGAVLFIDLDHFKTLNDTLGHDKGDQLLGQVAKRLNASVREGDTVARLGGDEFVVVLGGLNENAREAASQTEVVGEKILATLSQPYRLGEVEHLTTGSVGATLFQGHATSIDDLLKQADLAMYKSKDTGRNALRFFDPAMQTVVMERVAMEEQLRQALVASQFLLHYQAQVVSNHRVTGAEVLVRWKHPDRGMVSPAEFIPLAEETGLILPLGHWVLETACRQLACWATQPEMANLTVAVNVSAHQFRQADFVDQVVAVLNETGADPKKLKLELTESMLVSNVEDIVEKMFALKAKGVGFSLDDFGTGFSSLSYLKRLPLDQLKIDQSFVRDVLSDPNDAAIARTVISLAQSLGLGVIAEGVETEAQRDFLASSGCHAYQGYFFSRPLPVEGFEAFARRV